MAKLRNSDNMTTKKKTKINSYENGSTSWGKAIKFLRK